MRREDLEEARNDRDLHVRATHRAHEVQRRLVAADRRCEEDAVDLILLDDLRDLVGPAEDRRRRLGVVAVEEAHELEAVLGMRLDLALHEPSLRPTADHERAPRRHHARKDPASDRAADDGHEQQSGGEEERGFDRGVDPPVEEERDALGEDQVRQRAGQHGVEEIPHLVEAGNGDPQVVVLVQVIRGERSDPHERSRHGDQEEKPPRRRHRRKRAQLVGDEVREDVRRREREEIADDQHPRAPTLQPRSTRRPRPAPDILQPSTHQNDLSFGLRSGDELSLGAPGCIL